MIELVIDARRKDLGGFEVGRVLPFHSRRMVGPFIFLDQMGPAEFAPGATAIDVRPHPHIGLSTLTYLFEGEIMHHDNLGYDQAIRPGEVNWMTAGKGIVHSERTDSLKKSKGGPMHGMQAWVALPDEAEEMDPAFHHLGEDAQPAYENGGLFARLVAGEAYGAKAAVPVSSPLFYIHWELQPGVRTAPPSGKGSGGMSERALYVGQGLHRGRRPHLPRGPDDCAGADGRTDGESPSPIDRHGAGRRACGGTSDLVELRRLQPGPHRSGQGRLEGRPDDAAGRRRSGVHPPA
jgi:redox-sensitive bicupin YhaK (pirin superfamily)